jgi:glyoxylase-like metal-dependent hydrolase (beta-lactamase superfamily II)
MTNRTVTVQDLGYGISLIDLIQSGERGRTGAYILRGEEKTAIVDVGSALDIPNLLIGLKQLQISPEQIDYVIVTHIHLDHAGGVGTLLPYLPHATVVVHPRGARHLIDPSRLIAGARSVYGDQLEECFGQILPVPEERILIRNDEETLSLGGDRLLTFYDSPGHARHHFSIWDPVSQGIFSGDALGIRYVPELTGLDFEIIYPSSSPTEFDREAVFSTVNRLSKLPVKRIYHAHFGVTEPAQMAFERVLKGAAGFDDTARSLFYPGISWKIIAEALQDYMKQDMEQQGLQAPHSWKEFALDLELDAKGLLYRLEKEAKENGSVE